MYKAISVFFVLCLYACDLFSQVLPISLSQISPADGAQLHYRIIGFTFPATDNATKYTLEIATGSPLSEDLFNKNIIISKVSESNKIIAEVPSFGQRYAWRIVSTTRSGKIKSAFHYFQTLKNTLSDPAHTRVRIIKEASVHKDAYVFLDCTQTLYDMNGAPVWFVPSSIPDSSNFEIYYMALQDLKMSSLGTVTYLQNNNRMLEIDYSGRMLWAHPNQVATGIVNAQDELHHTFTRLNNGHYMVLSNEIFYWRKKSSGDKIARNAADTAELFMQPKVGTLEEYDRMGNRLWKWSSADYIRHSDLYPRMTSETERDLDVHLNSFFFDEKSSTIYLGFRNLNRIIKISYPKAKVLNSYGKLYTKDAPDFENKLFCHQHSILVPDDKYLYLYDNNACGTPPNPKLLIFEEPEEGVGIEGLKKIWEYEYKPRDPQMPVRNNGAPLQIQFKRSRGGNIEVLPDGTIFASLSSPYSDLLLLDRDKQLLWNARVEKWDTTKKDWTELPMYRASIIPSRKSLEELIWAEQ